MLPSKKQNWQCIRGRRSNCRSGRILNDRLSASVTSTLNNDLCPALKVRAVWKKKADCIQMRFFMKLLPIIVYIRSFIRQFICILLAVQRSDFPIFWKPLCLSFTDLCAFNILIKKFNYTSPKPFICWCLRVSTIKPLSLEIFVAFKLYVDSLIEQFKLEQYI